MKRQYVFVWALVALATALSLTASSIPSQEPPAPIKVGAMAPTVRAHEADGRDVTVSFLERATVLYVVSPGCGWCIRNLANVTELWRQRKAEYAFVGLSPKQERLQEFLKANPHPFPVFVASRQTIDEYGLGTMPSTIVIAKGGLVVQKWNGAFNNSLPAVEKFFGVKLPGISGGGPTRSGSLSQAIVDGGMP
jgi:peroxiredoxin